MKFDKDVYSSTTPEAAGAACFHIITTIQTLNPNLQVAGASLFFVALCDRLRLDPSELINQAQRRLSDAQSVKHDSNQKARELANALTHYITNEIK